VCALKDVGRREASHFSASSRYVSQARPPHFSSPPPHAGRASLLCERELIAVSLRLSPYLYVSLCMSLSVAMYVGVRRTLLFSRSVADVLMCLLH